ncbi:MAG: SelT/SelW/SelH family protein [Thermoanaerobaculaceae bacterium]|nr:SelT/SelW/SelH family protein [Thermoanaerobaculaceae bacterium]NLH12812.1 SelT/SelW/SelH family protein [Holophagae bacterium]
MAAEIEQAFGAEVTTVKGSGGVFDVVVDGVEVFSKHVSGRFPEPGEVVRKLRT